MSDINEKNTGELKGSKPNGLLNITQTNHLKLYLQALKFAADTKSSDITIASDKEKVVCLCKTIIENSKSKISILCKQDFEPIFHYEEIYNEIKKSAEKGVEIQIFTDVDYVKDTYGGINNVKVDKLIDYEVKVGQVSGFLIADNTMYCLLFDTEKIKALGSFNDNKMNALLNSFLKQE